MVRPGDWVLGDIDGVVVAPAALADEAFRLALEKAPAGSQLYAAAEEGITVREIAQVIGRHLNVPAVSIPAEQAADHFTAFPFITLDITMSNADTRQLLGWEPVHPGLIADLEDGHYFTTD